MRRPRLTRTIIEALGAVRAAAQIELDSGETDETRDAELQRGITYLDDLRAWYWAQHETVDDDSNPEADRISMEQELVESADNSRDCTCGHMHVTHGPKKAGDYDHDGKCSLCDDDKCAGFEAAE